MDYLAFIAFGFVAGFTFAFEIVAVILTVKPESQPSADAGPAEDFA